MRRAWQVRKGTSCIFYLGYDCHDLVTETCASLFHFCALFQTQLIEAYIPMPCINFRYVFSRSESAMANVSKSDVMDKVQQMAKIMVTKKDVEELRKLLQQGGNSSKGDNCFCNQHRMIPLK